MSIPPFSANQRQKLQFISFPDQPKNLQKEVAGQQGLRPYLTSHPLPSLSTPPRPGDYFRISLLSLLWSSSDLAFNANSWALSLTLSSPCPPTQPFAYDTSVFFYCDNTFVSRKMLPIQCKEDGHRLFQRSERHYFSRVAIRGSGTDRRQRRLQQRPRVSQEYLLKLVSM